MATGKYNKKGVTMETTEEVESGGEGIICYPGHLRRQRGAAGCEVKKRRRSEKEIETKRAARCRSPSHSLYSKISLREGVNGLVRAPAGGNPICQTPRSEEKVRLSQAGTSDCAGPWPARNFTLNPVPAAEGLAGTLPAFAPSQAGAGVNFFDPPRNLVGGEPKKPLPVLVLGPPTNILGASDCIAFA